jgi:hypothetical protein
VPCRPCSATAVVTDFTNLWLSCCVIVIVVNRIVKLVRAIRKGWIKTGKAKRAEQQQPQVYLLWGDNDQVSLCCC